jgi:phosphohistidine swiveling domain-containing protein
VCLGSRREYFRKSLGWDFGIANYRYREFTHQISVADFERLDAIVASYVKHGDFYEHYLVKCEAANNLLDKVSRQIALNGKGALNKTAAADAFDEFAIATKNAIPFLASIIFVQNRLEGALQKMVGECLGSDAKADQVKAFIAKNVVPPQAANVALEARGALKLAAMLESSGVTANDLSGPAPEVMSVLETRCPGFHEALNSHIGEHGWLRTFTYMNDPFSVEEMLARVTTLLMKQSPKARLAQTEQRELEERETLERTVAQVKNDDLKALIRLGAAYSYARFNRIDLHFRCETKIRDLEKQIANMMQITRDELVFCTYPEISRWLHGDVATVPSKSELEARRTQGFDAELRNGEFLFSTAENHAINTSDHPVEEIDWPLIGTAGCVGRARGTARLVLSAADMQSLRLGDILVTTMTTPDLMLAIEKASAIVTDEGGMTCHAAIISRELQIPCVIGTEMATMCIKDGMTIEVDARHGNGFVNLIKRASS